jgi:hypothetical protein
VIGKLGDGRQKHSPPSPILFQPALFLIPEVVKDVADQLKLCLF